VTKAENRNSKFENEEVRHWHDPSGMLRARSQRYKEGFLTSFGMTVIFCLIVLWRSFEGGGGFDFAGGEMGDEGAVGGEEVVVG
jgi:hypothetical protein